MDDVRELFKVMDIKEAAKIFFTSLNKSERRKNNYNDLTINYYSLFFNKYMHIEILSEKQQELHKFISIFRCNFYLVGGTAYE